MKVINILYNDDYMSIQFNANKTETKEMAKLFGTSIKEMKGCWFWLAQERAEKEILDCIQVYNDTWESNCDLVKKDFKESSIAEVQNLFNKALATTSKEELEKLVGTTVDLKVAA